MDASYIFCFFVLKDKANGEHWKPPIIQKMQICYKQKCYKPDTSESKNTSNETENSKSTTNFCDKIQH